MLEPISDFVLSDHAVEEMQLRRINRAIVAAVLAAPEQRFAIRQGRDVFQARRYVGGREYLVRVFVDVNETPPTVVTVYQTSKVSKYWRSSNEGSIRS